MKLPEDLPDTHLHVIQLHIESIKHAIQSMHPQHRFPQVLSNGSKTAILAIGKNAYVQAVEAAEILKPELVIVHQARKYCEIDKIHGGWIVYELNHPIPDKATFIATANTISELSNLTQEHVLHVLVSGGASALFAMPEPEVASQYSSLVREAIAEGFPIHELNSLRILMDQVKGGKLLNRLKCRIKGWYTSDVITDDVRVIGSGPTSPGIEVSQRVIEWLGNRTSEETVKLLVSRLPRENHDDINKIITTRMDFINALTDQYQKNNLAFEIIDSHMQGEVDECAGKIAEQVLNCKGPLALIWSGEATIDIDPELPGAAGGRLSALAMHLAEKIEGKDNIYFLLVATDGKDGSSPKAGYIITSKTARHLRPLGGSINLIRRGISGKVLDSFGYTFDIDQTDINLLDIIIALVF